MVCEAICVPSDSDDDASVGGRSVKGKAGKFITKGSESRTEWAANQLGRQNSNSHTVQEGT
eukprot:10549948-Heterocapsa_arctica.AAC.1